MQNYKKITVTFILFLAVIFLLPEKALAQEIWGMDKLDGLNLGTQSLAAVISGIINIALGFLGIIALVIILYGGFLWMTSAGNVEKVDKAKKTLLNGFIGLMIITSAYAIVQFLFKDVMDSINGSGGSGGGGSAYNAPTVGLGAEVLDSHYPAVDATDVPRNTNIYITFTEDMGVDTIVIDDATCTNNGPNERTCFANTGFLNVMETVSGATLPFTELLVTFDPTAPLAFGINPYGDTANHLGNDTDPVKYTVELNNFLTDNDAPAFRHGNVYRWNFTVSTELDTTPPTVVSVLPVDGAIDIPLNSVIQINFSEAVNPIFAGGTYAPFTNITLTRPAGIIEGQYQLANQYRTVEFLTTNDCGVNSCGDKIYCLPEGSYTIDGLVTAVISDMAGNQLNTDGDATFGEPGDDDYLWSFDVIDEIETDPPHMIQMDGTTGVALDTDIQVIFNEELMASTVNGRTTILERVDPISGLTVPINYWSSVTTTAFTNDTILIHHQDFNSNTDYLPKLKSSIKNTTQNCWYPCDCSGPSCRCTNNDPAFGPNPCAGPNCRGDDI